MKKSDIAIYVSAILTLILTAFVVLGTNKITYESEINKILQDDKKADSVAITKKKDSSLFETKLPEMKVDSSSVAKLDGTTNATIDTKKVATTKSFADLNSVDTIITKSKPSKVKKVTLQKKIKLATTKPMVNKKKQIIKRYKKQRTNYRVSNNKSKFYTVKSGDVLWKIAKRFKTKTMKIIRVNKINNPNLIYPGMRIKLPV